MKLCRSHTAIRATFLLLSMIFLICACQVNVPPAPTATTIVPARIEPALLATSTLAISSPTVLPPSRTPRPSTTPSPEASVTPAPALLSAGGPWLLYQRMLLYPEGGFFKVLFVSNQDGSGMRMINGPGCETSTPVSIPEDPANRLTALDEKYVLFNLERAVVQSIASDCRMRFSGSAAGGLLATIDRAGAAPELRVYELPEGKLRSTFAIPSCSKSGQACGFDSEPGRWVAEWDPGGRYLIFPVILDENRSDLYLYEARTGEMRQLASVEGRVSRIWWSPEGANILLGVSPGGDYFLESFWTAAVASGETRRLSTAEDYLNDVELLDWLDENRFLFYSGSLQYVVTAGAYNLRMLDIRSNKETTLFGDGFIMAGLDRRNVMVGMIVAVYNSQYEDGVYLVPVATPAPQKIASIETAGIYDTSWDEELQLFVTGDACEDGGQGLRAFDAKGNWQCAPRSLPTEIPPAIDHPSPDGQWRAVTKEGLWVERIGEPAVKVDDMTASQVIWRLDSGGFFFIARGDLYYVSLADLAVQRLDGAVPLRNGLRWGSDQVAYQWIGTGEGK